MQQFFHPQDFRTATLFFNCIKPFISKAAGSGELAWQEGERGQLCPQPLLQVVSQTVAALCGLRKLRRRSRAGSVSVHPVEDLAQGYLNGLNSMFLHYVDYLTRGDKMSVFSLSKTDMKSAGGDYCYKYLGSGHSGVKKPRQLCEPMDNVMLVCEQMGIDYPCAKFRLRIGRKQG